MNKELENKLTTKYPSLFRNIDNPKEDDVMYYGIACGDGWFKILDDLFYMLSQYTNLHLTAVKEKLGALRVYIGMNGFVVSHTISKEIFGQLIDAELKSMVTCDVCGGKGSLKGDLWIRTRCDSCDEKYHNQRCDY